MKCLLLPIAVKSNTPLHSMLLCIRLYPLIPILLGSLIQSTEKDCHRNASAFQRQPFNSQIRTLQQQHLCIYPR
jgi:hypothetical protein